eukprot:3178938-Prymnesium_polylepis.1
MRGVRSSEAPEARRSAVADHQDGGVAAADEHGKVRPAARPLVGHRRSDRHGGALCRARQQGARGARGGHRRRRRRRASLGLRRLPTAKGPRGRAAPERASATTAAALT